MGIIFILLPLSLLLALIGLAGYFWCVRSGQFEDLEGPAARVLKDD
jgi:cbb3-type cytochrome oxidase maturation protein